MWCPDGSRNPVPKQGARGSRKVLDPQGPTVLSMSWAYGAPGESYVAMWSRVPFQVCGSLEALVSGRPHMPHVP